jgi:hypothetical protein
LQFLHEWRIVSGAYARRALCLGHEVGLNDRGESKKVAIAQVPFSSYSSIFVRALVVSGTSSFRFRDRADFT